MTLTDPPHKGTNRDWQGYWVGVPEDWDVAAACNVLPTLPIEDDVGKLIDVE